MITKSETTGRVYDTDACVYITDWAQALFYLQHGAMLQDVAYGRYPQRVTFIFRMADTKKLYRLWTRAL